MISKFSLVFMNGHVRFKSDLTSNFVCLRRLADPGEALVVSAHSAHLSVVGEAGRGRGCGGGGRHRAPARPAQSPGPGPPHWRPLVPLAAQTQTVEGGNEVVLRREVAGAHRPALRQLLQVGRDPVRRRLWPPEVVAEVVAEVWRRLQVVGELP